MRNTDLAPRLKVADLFCGCGGFSLGFEQVGFDIVYGLDNWQVACDSFSWNFPKAKVECKDALVTDPGEIPDVDIIIGGPPCQPFSIARAGIFSKKDTRTFDLTLTNWFLKVVQEKNPQFWIMENVRAVAKFLPKWIPKVKVYEMWQFGVPQFRPRMFAGLFPEPTPTPLSFVFPTVLASEDKGGIVERRRKNSLGIRLGSIFRRRSLLPEAKLVQTFPLDYVLCGNLTDQYTMIGNAVPPLMAFHLAKAIATEVM